jgi:selenocysteine-specific translation elongation factor
MRGVTYAVAGSDELAGRLAKKGTATDVTLYNAKKGDAHLNLVTPSRYPDKLQSLLVALDLADEVILAPQQADRWLGETIVACELFGKTRGFARPGPQLPPDQLRQLLARTQLKEVEVTEEPEAVFRERVYERATSTPEGSLVVPVDHSFPVKGVGTVVLALVRQGELKVHQTLQAFPETDTLEVRSIQVHDVDHKSAPGRSRVGLAVKGVEADRVPRGAILAPPGTLRVLEAGTPHTFPLALHAFNKWTPRAGTVLHPFHVLQDRVLRVDAVDGASLTGRLDAPLAVVPTQPAVLVDLDNKVQRLVGRVTLPG